MIKLIKFIFILSLIDPITNSPFENLKKGFLMPKGSSEKLIQNLPNLNEQSIGETSKNIEKMKKLAKNESRLEEVKIRVIYQPNNDPGHAFIVVGDYEYDFMMAGARRRIFRYDLANKLEKNDKERPQAFKGLGLFVCQRKVEQSFFEMGSRFWFGESFSPINANCLDFVFNFMCTLFDGNCPKKEIWPNNFVNFDKDMFRDYLKLGDRRQPASALERKPISLPADDEHNCVLKDHHLEFRITNLKCDVNDEGGICANFVLSHFTGLFDVPVLMGKELKNRILVETKPKKVWKDGKNIHLVAVLKAYSCKILANLSMSSVGYLILLNKTTKKFIKTKNVCHSHFFGLINLDEIIGHIVEVEFDGWTQINPGKNN
ncbi:hypothetical protein GPALN_016270 [Globodera pallida]|nr:hypothetical protein GPALN_016270 [Globodera pallida]